MKSIYITYMGLTEPLLYSQALNYLKGLSQKGIAIYIVSFEKKQFLKDSDIKRIKDDLGQYGIKWAFLKYHKRVQFLSKPYDIIRGVFFVTYLSVKENIDVIHARGTFCAFIGIISKCILRKKMIFDMRGLMAEEYVDARLWKRDTFIYAFVSRIEKYFLKKADEVVVLTDKIKNILLSKYKVIKISVIPTCVNLEDFSINKKNAKEFTMIYIGAIGTWYMLPEMIDFYSVLCRTIEKSRFIILSQADRRIIEKSIPDNIKDRVVVKSVEHKRVADYLNAADIGISFIKPCFSKIASCPTKFAESLACGLPVVINSGIGDTDEIVREHRIGVVIENFNIGEYKKNIEEIKMLLEEGYGLRDRCRKVAKNYFSLKEGIEKYFQIYTRLGR